MSEVQELLSRLWHQKQPDDLVEGLKKVWGLWEKIVDPFDLFGGDDTKESRQGQSGIIAAWLEKYTERMFYDFMDLAEIPDKDKPAFYKRFKQTVGEGWWGIIIATGSLLVMAAAYVKNTIGGVDTFADQVTKKIQQPEMPGLDHVMNYAWRNPADETLKDYIRKHGYSDTAFKIIEGASRPIWSLDDISVLRQAYKWNDKAVMDALRDLGYPDLPDDSPEGFQTLQAKYLIRPAIPIGDILEVERRGKWDKGGYLAALKRHGLDAQARSLYKVLQERLPSSNELQELYRRALIDNATFMKGIKSLGVREDLRVPIAKLSETIPDYYLARTLWWRGIYNDEQYIEALRHQGYSEATSAHIKEVSSLMPTPTDLIRFGLREVFDPVIRRAFQLDLDFPKDILPWGKKIGLGDEVIRMHWASHWDLPGTEQGFRLFHRKKITMGQLKMLLKAKDVMPFWREKLIALSYNLIPRRVLPKLVKQGLLTYKQLVQRFDYLGYDPADAKIMAKSAIESAKEADKQLSKGDIVAAFVYGDIQKPAMESMLKELGYKDTPLRLVMVRAGWKRIRQLRKEAAALIADEADEAKEATKGEILKGYKAGAIGKSTAAGLLRDVGYSPQTITYLLSLQDFIQAREVREHKGAQLRKLFDKRIVSDTAAVTTLSRYGYTNAAAKILVSNWSVERNTQEQLAAAKVKTPTKADLNDWLKKNIIEGDEWWDRMISLGYNARDVTAYYLELQHDIRET